MGLTFGQAVIVEMVRADCNSPTFEIIREKDFYGQLSNYAAEIDAKYQVMLAMHEKKEWGKFDTEQGE
ncbi:MAG: hypothetical protein WC373_17340 [Smithella sp.]|jgi:hypothetical protein